MQMNDMIKLAMRQEFTFVDSLRSTFGHTIYTDETWHLVQSALVKLIADINNVHPGVVSYAWHCEKYGEIDL